MTIEKRNPPGVELTAIAFFPHDQVPDRVSLRDLCNLPFLSPVPGYLAGVTGHQRGAYLGAAARYAEAQEMEMVALDLRMKTAMPVTPLLMTPELLPCHDSILMSRVSKTLRELIAKQWRGWLVEEKLGAIDDYDWRNPVSFMAKHTPLISRLLALPAFKHVNFLAHPAQVAFEQTPITMRSVKLDYAMQPGVIAAADLRFHPEISLVA